ncbi:MAG TPA: 50S ribosomal protein L4 [Candidatus Krumholzibacteria bacterium]|nr:50S ribosomal protein L4 [Candidatus Krumholzibacteria bacterium]
MTTAQGYSAAGEETEKVPLPEALFAAEVHTHVLYEAVKSYLGNQRQGTHKTKNRHEVSGQKSKLYRQKGTGRARAGSATSGTRVGGGRIFGPRPRDYRTQPPARVRRMALCSALSDRAAGAQVRVVDDLKLEAPSTKSVAKLLAGMGLAAQRVLLVSSRDDSNLFLSCRNVQRLQLQRAQELNAYTVLRAETLVIEKSALQTLEEVFGR